MTEQRKRPLPRINDEPWSAKRFKETSCGWLVGASSLATKYVVLCFSELFRAALRCTALHTMRTPGIASCVRMPGL